jgi:hypothetical protein
MGPVQQSQPEWLTRLWDDLTGMEPVDRIKVTGDWIIYVTQHLLPDLGTFRRQQVARLVAQPEWDPRRLAETIGSRTSTINRLASEGRRLDADTSAAT